MSDHQDNNKNPEEASFSPQRLAEIEKLNMKNWTDVTDALKTSTFHGRYASVIAGLIDLAQLNLGEAKKRFEFAADQIKMQTATFGENHHGPRNPFFKKQEDKLMVREDEYARSKMKAPENPLTAAKSAEVPA